MSKPRIIVTGGAGYIGSHVVKALVEKEYCVMVYDRKPIPGGLGALQAGGLLHGIQADLADRAALDAALRKFEPNAAINLAGYIAVGESVRDPGKYYDNNIANGLNLLDALLAGGVKCFVFSSSAAVYGMPREVPIAEDHPTAPINPYGRTKWFFEHILRDYDAAYGLRSISLRYFNAAGADHSGEIGEAHDPETHLVPLVLQVPMGLRDSVAIFGSDYPTRDGTCVRDYIHVTDLADAHVRAVEALLDGSPTDVFNLGNGEGCTVREVIAAAEEVVGTRIKTLDTPRRPGDPAALVASSEKAMQKLGWRPKHNTLKIIIQTAWQWHKRQMGKDA
jgi:UDP-glucose 4-epimerase